MAYITISDSNLTFQVNIQQRFQQLSEILTEQYTEEDRQIVACPRTEQVRFQQLSEILTEQYTEEDRQIVACLNRTGKIPTVRALQNSIQRRTDRLWLVLELNR